MLGPQYGIANLEREMLAESMLKEGQKATPALAFPDEERSTKPGAFKVSSLALRLYKKEMGVDPDKTLFRKTRQYVADIQQKTLPTYFGKKPDNEGMAAAQDFIAGKPRMAFNKWLSLLQRTDPRLAKYVRDVPSNASLIFYLFVTRVSGRDMADVILKRYFATESDHIGAVKARLLKNKGKAAEGTEDAEAAEERLPGGSERVLLADILRGRIREEAGASTFNYAEMSVSEIARQVRKHWKNVNFAAKPYLDAMMGMETVDDNYGQDPGRHIVSYFLSNANSFKGPEAKAIKAELKSRLSSR